MDSSNPGECNCLIFVLGGSIGRSHSKSAKKRKKMTAPCTLNHDHGPFRATQIWNEIVTHLKLTVEVKRRRHKMKYIDNCFTGSDAVTVVLEYLLEDQNNFGTEICREKAVKLCHTLMDRSVFEPVTSRVSEGKRPVFEDSHNKLYRFIGVDTSDTRSLAYESDGEMLDDSEDEEGSGCSPGEERRNVQDLEPDMMADDDIICNPILLSKQGHMVQEVLQLRKGVKRKSVAVVRQSMNGAKFARRFSIPEGMKFGDQPGEIRPGAYDDMWREVALRKLLTLVDVPILDGLLSDDKPTKRTHRFNLVISNALNNQFGSPSSAAGHDDPWVQSALEVLEGLPMSLSIFDKELQGQVPAGTKRELLKAITKHYKSSEEPLMPERFVDIYLAILNLILQEKDTVALEALQLVMILLPWQTIEEVQRLFRFMAAVSEDPDCILEKEEENKIVMINTFTDILVQHAMISHNLSAVLVGFILTNMDTVFTIPKEIGEKVCLYLTQMRQGKLDPVIEESFCARLTEEESQRQCEEATQQGLRDIIDAILDDTKIPLKEKKLRLKQFQKFHPQICAQYFPDIA